MKTSRFVAFLLLPAILLGAGKPSKPVSGKPSPISAREERRSKRDALRAEMLKERLALAAWCAGNRLPVQARSQVVALGIFALPPADREKVDKLILDLEDGADTEEAKVLSAWVAKRVASEQKLAKLCAGFGSWCLKNGYPSEGSTWLMRAFDMHGKLGVTLAELEKAASAAAKSGDLLEAARCLDYVVAHVAPEARAKPKAALDALGEGLAGARKARDEMIEKARTSWVERGVLRHGIRYGLSLPEGFDPAKDWPLVVSVTGSAGNWDDEVQSWGPHRSRGYVVVSPATVSNVNEQGGQFRTLKPLPYDEKVLSPLHGSKAVQMAWESEGIEAIVEELHRDLNVDPDRVVVTGLSGGGNLAYYSMFHRRSNLRAVAPRNPNFYPQNLDLAAAPRGKGPEPFPVHIFEAGNDEYAQTIGPGGPPGVRPQTEAGLAELKTRGFSNVRHTVVPDVTHNESYKYYGQILDWFDEVLGKK